MTVALVLHIAVESVSAQSDGAIRGRVIAAADDSGLAGATGTLISPSSGAVIQRHAKAQGSFSFSNVTPGEYVLSASAEGFVSRDLEVVIEPREVRMIIVTMEVAGVSVAVEVAGGRTSVPGTHSPSSTNLTLERLEPMPVFQRLTLSDAIVSLAPGRGPVRFDGLDDTRQSARESCASDWRSDRHPHLVQSLFRAPANRGSAVEQRGPDTVDR